MKVISIRQPWASLIVHGYKEYEFRSWNTKFRGKCLIHASSGVDETSINKFSKYNLDYPLGKIIGSVEINDVIPLDEDFKRELLDKNELVYGGIKVNKEYAFKCEKVKILKEPIEVKGELGFWEYYTPEEITSLMKEIKLDEEIKDMNYKLKSPKEVISTNLGTNFERIELARYYFRNYLNVKTYLLYNDKKVSHPFLTYERDSRIYLFFNKEIKEFKDLESLLEFVKKNLISEKLDFEVYYYKKPKANLTLGDYYKHIIN